MRDPLKPPERIVTSEISKAARRLERLKLRRRAMLKKLTAVEDDIRDAGRALRDLVRDSTAPAAGEQTTLANGDLTTQSPLCPICQREFAGTAVVSLADGLTYHARCAP